MADPSPQESAGALHGKLVAFVGKLASMPRREAAQLIRQHGGTLSERLDAAVNLIVVGEEELQLPGADGSDDWLDADLREAAEQGRLEIVTETALFQRLGLVEQTPDIHRLYTPAMLAELLRVPLAVVRRWHRRGLIVPVREVRRLPYFDFQEVATARRLAEMLAAGVSPRAIEKKLEALVRYLPGVARPSAKLSTIIEGKEILLRQGDGLLEPGGQLRFDFDASESARAGRIGEATAAPDVVSWPGDQAAGRSPTSAQELCRVAAEAEEEGRLEAAAELYRAALVAEGPEREISFQLAELLYRLNDLGAARERYYMAIEIDEDYVEARANLGCVLAETGRRDLALAAFEGALAYHADYADVHYHFARLLDELRRSAEAEDHWRAFLSLAPDSPWADEARLRLGLTCSG